MIEVRPLTRLDATALKRIASGYSSDSKYVVTHLDSASHASIDLQLVALTQPFTKKYDHFDAEIFQRYHEVLKDNYSFGAYDGELLVGLLIAEARLWNQSLWVCEFHVADTHRTRGIGKRLMEGAAAKAKQAGLRIIVCETQNTNAVAIRVYRQLGFGIEGIDISYYSNTDYPEGEMAIFMKRRLR